MNTTPVCDGSKPAPVFARVYLADSLGRCDYQVFEQFRTRKAACAYWWMLARKGQIAYLPDEIGFGRTNAGLAREREPGSLIAWIDQCEREYDAEGAGFDEGAEYARLMALPWHSRSAA